jgi:hypothetical protein
MEARQDEFFKAHMALVEAASRIYFAGVWKMDAMPIEEQRALWEALRDSLGLKPGSATARRAGA